MSSTTETGTVTNRPLRIAGGLMITIGAAMAAMPFVGAAMGVFFDAYGSTDINRNRILLHVLPGVVGCGLGVMLFRAAKRRAGEAAPSWLPAVAGLSFLVSVWMGAGPWILDAILPASDNGKMFLGIPGFGQMSKAHQMTLEGFCHWVPGMCALGATWIATAVLRRETARRSAPARAAL